MRKKIILIVAVVLLVGAYIGNTYYQKIYASNVKTDTSILIPTEASFDDVVALLKPHLEDLDGFIWVANQKKYSSTVKTGKFNIKAGMNANELVNLLRSGKQATIKLTFNNQDTLEKLAGRLSQQIEADSITILASFSDRTFLTENNLSRNSLLSIFIPNSYEVYWNSSPESIKERMLKEYKRFWNDSRLNKATALNMNPEKVMILASIVQKETAKVTERPLVAGLYLNRLRDGWALQADPTVIYVLKQKHGQDYEVKRVLNDDLELVSPYNTYLNTGLPPSLIAMPDISSIDAVLNPKKHDYYYMCASVTDIGAHAFAKNISQHNRNAAKYHKWLSKQGINR